MVLVRTGPIALAILLLASCTSFQYRYSAAEESRLMARALGPEKFDEPLATPLALSPGVARQLDKAIPADWNDGRKLDGLRRMLFDSDQLDIRYNSSKTKTAMELWNSGTGNCLSLTNLFVASARHLGLDATFETVEVSPSWDLEEGTMVRYDHIVATGKLKTGKQYVVDFLPEFSVGDQRARQISDDHALALYYNNLGAENIIGGDYQVAISHLRRALRIYPRLSDVWNNLGTAYGRTGEADLSEFAYQRSLQLDENNYSALSNLAHFYVSVGKPEAAKYFQGRVQWYREHNPYFVYYAAHKKYQAGDYKAAIALLKRASSMKPEEPTFYDALARCYAMLGDEKTRKQYHDFAVQRRKLNELERLGRNDIVQVRRKASHIE